MSFMIPSSHRRSAFAAVLTASLLSHASCASAQGARWQALSPYQRELVGVVLPEERTTPLDDDEVTELLRQRGVRGGSYVANGLLLRDEGVDRADARALIRRILEVQVDRPGGELNGGWPTSIDPARDRLDRNWREFVGTSLIIARKLFAAELGPELVTGIDTAVLRAARGSAERDVSPSYTNIALMSAFLMDVAGHLDPGSGLREKGLAKARAIHEEFCQHDTFAEYNSPTYYGVDLVALGMWRRLADSPDLRKRGIDMEHKLWRDIGQFYHAGLKNICGPYVRARGMDMTRYMAPTGVAIALSLDDPDLAPVPPGDDAHRLGEWAYAPLFVLLEVRPSSEIAAELTSFSAPRRLHRKILHKGRDYTVDAVLHEHWMMGATNGLRRSWEQHFPATVHWRAPDGSTSWLLVHGSSGVTATLDHGIISLKMPERDPERPLRLYLDPAGTGMPKLTGSRLSLPGFAFDLETPLGEPSISRIKDNGLGKVIELAWLVPDSVPLADPVLTIAPLPLEPQVLRRK